MKPRITKPGRNDLEWMLVVCTPRSVQVDFFETESDAMKAAETLLIAIGRGTTTYVGHVSSQGELR